MTIGSYFRSTGLTVFAAPNIFSGIGATDDITDPLLSWSHNLAAMGGYKSASLSLAVTAGELDDWLDNGLGKDITMYSASGQMRFNGFVNNITATIGGLNITIGPLMQVANRVYCVFSTVDTSISPPAVGVRANTATYSDTQSQAVYGLQEKVLSIGGATAANAAQIAQTYLNEYSIPQSSQSLTLGGGNAISLKLDLLGYVELLKSYPYTNAATGMTTISTRLPLVLAAHSSSIYSTDYAGIATNTTDVPSYENNSRSAWTIIVSLVEKGDSSFNRYLFGIYANRRAFYSAAPSAIEYYHQISSEYPEVVDIAQSRVDPWDVLPGKWLQVNDILVGRVNPSSLSADPRNIFIESLTYTAPYGLSINGGKASKLPQLLGRLGLSGVGAK